MDLSTAAKLTVGDIADYEAWRRDRRKRELIDTIKELHSDNIPADALVQIENELRKIPSLMSGDEDAFDIIAAQYLFWKVMLKSDSSLTMQQVGELLEGSRIEEYAAALFPASLDVSKKKPVMKRASKKVTRKARKKKKKASR